MRSDVVIDFPFGDGTGWKVRPAVVVQDDSIYSINVTVVLITSQKNLFGRSRLLIDPTKSDGQGSGLRITSVAACENFYFPESESHPQRDREATTLHDGEDRRIIESRARPPLMSVPSPARD